MIRILNEILDEIRKTNKLLVAVESHLRELTLPPDLKTYNNRNMKTKEFNKEEEYD